MTVVWLSVAVGIDNTVSRLLLFRVTYVNLQVDCFVAGDFTEEGLRSDVSGLERHQLAAVKSWQTFYHNSKEYVFVGRWVRRIVACFCNYCLCFVLFVLLLLLLFYPCALQLFFVLFLSIFSSLFFFFVFLAFLSYYPFYTSPIRLIGTFYTSKGLPTEQLLWLRNELKRFDAEQEEEEKQKQSLPACNSRWSSSGASEVRDDQDSKIW